MILTLALELPPLSPASRFWQECDRSQTDSLEDEEIEAFYKMLTQREEIDRAFAEAAGSAPVLSVDQLVAFLQHVQREEEAGPRLALSLIERYEPNETGEGAWAGPTTCSARASWARGKEGLTPQWAWDPPVRHSCAMGSSLSLPLGSACREVALTWGQGRMKRCILSH